MRPTLALLICAALATTACSRISDSRLNPLNWFGKAAVTVPVDGTSTRTLVPPEARNRVLDARVLAATILDLGIDRTPDGAIVRATGTAPSGAFNAEMVPVAQTGDTLTLALRIEQGPGHGGQQVITAARLLDNRELAGVRRVIVQAQQNTASATR